MDEIVRAIAEHTAGVVTWHVDSPLSMVDDISPLCTETDKFLLDHPGLRVTITVERTPGIPSTPQGLLTGDGRV